MRQWLGGMLFAWVSHDKQPTNVQQLHASVAKRHAFCMDFT
jgi:hypothetical protein